MSQDPWPEVTAAEGRALRIHIPGEPVAKGRPRFARGRAYTPEKTASWEAFAKWQARMQLGAPPILQGPVSVTVTATFAVPLSWPKAKREAALRGEIAHVSRPDGDNLLKAMDAFNGLLWVDDAQITRAVIEKRYGSEPGVVVEVVS